jgi:hypothetical protein
MDEPWDGGKASTYTSITEKVRILRKSVNLGKLNRGSGIVLLPPKGTSCFLHYTLKTEKR